MIPLEGKMKKSERINQELFFINEHKEFNLADLMKRFGISKSTALRDIEELESLGVPLYVDSGRYGGYKVIHQGLLPPIYFNEKEVSAIFFSLQLLKSVVDSPFGHSYEHISQKLVETFDQKRQTQILRTVESVRYEGITQIAATDNLDKLFACILNEQLVTFTYTRYTTQKREIAPIRLSILDGFWYCTGFDVIKKEWRTYRCDFIEIIEIKEGGLRLSKAERDASFIQQEESYRRIPFKVKTTQKGKEFFLKRHFSNMCLTQTKGNCYIEGKINSRELEFLATYLIGFGKEVRIQEPVELKETYKNLLREMLEQQDDLSFE